MTAEVDEPALDGSPPLCGERKAPTHTDLESALGALAPQLRVFASVARHEHVTRAANELGLSQPGISRALARLESALGVTLLRRTGRSLRLTTEGRSLQKSVDQALEELRAGLLRMSDDSDRLRRRISLAFLPSLGTTVVPELVRGYREQFGDIHFDLVQDTHPVLLEALRSGDSDLVITAPCPGDEEFEHRVLGEEEIRLVVPRDHPLAERTDGVRLLEAAGESFAGPRADYGLSGAIDAWCHEAGFTPRISFQGGDTATLRGFVAAGLGIALLPVSRTKQPDSIVEVPVTWPRTTRTIGALWRRDEELRPPAAAFRDYLCSLGTTLLDNRH